MLDDIHRLLFANSQDFAASLCEHLRPLWINFFTDSNVC
jgi:hypothetical protein